VKSYMLVFNQLAQCRVNFLYVLKTPEMSFCLEAEHKQRAVYTFTES